MLSTIQPRNKLVVGALAGLIAALLVAGVVAALTKSDDTANPAATAQARDREAQARQQRQDREAAQRAAAQAAEDRTAYDAIIANQQTCNNKYLPEANARADAARRALHEQQAALNEVLAKLPPGKARDTLAAQIPSQTQSAEALINSEQRAAEQRCAMALTIYQYTHDSLPGPPGS